MTNPNVSWSDTNKTTAASTMSPVSKDLSSLPRETKGGGDVYFKHVVKGEKEKKKKCVCVLGGGWVGGL